MANTNIQSFSGDVEVTSNLTVDTNTLHVDSVAGRVGIGKTDPGFALDVSGTVNATALYVDGSEFVSGLWTSNASNAYYTTGAVGIGTDFPQKDLEVQGILRLSNAATGETSDLVVKTGDWDSGTKITAPDAAPSDFLGFGCAISDNGSYAVVGARYEDPGGTTNAGAAYIFKRTGTNTWNSVYKIAASDAQASDYFGGSVSISDDGSWVAVGSPGETSPYYGAAYIFKRTGTNTWDTGIKIVAPDRQAVDYFGGSVSISPDGSWVIASANGEDNTTPTPNSGAAYIYQRTTSTNSWTYKKKLIASDYTGGVRFGGGGVAISEGGSWSAVVANGYGAVYIFKYDGTTWDGGYKIAAGLNSIQCSISSDGSRVVVGASTYSSARGQALIYKRTHATNNTWSLEKYITAPDAQVQDSFGWAVSISGDGSWVAVGAWGENAGNPTTPRAGSLYTYKYNGSSWIYQSKHVSSTPVNNAQLGYHVDISGEGPYVIGGASYDQAPAYQGAAYIFSRPKSILSTTTPIEAAGTLLSFTGQHICFPEGPMSQGLVVSANKNKYVTLNGPPTTGARAIKSSESLPVVSLSNVASDCSAFGVVDHFENGGTKRTQTSGATVVRSDKELGDNRVIVNSLGEGAMWVANTNGPLESGDYITTSNIAGYGQRQEDSDTLYSYTVAKITMDCDFDPEDVPVQIIKKDGSGQNVLDEYGRIQWEEVPDQTKKAYNIRYLTTDGGVTDEANAVWKAAYVGCTYHCG